MSGPGAGAGVWVERAAWVVLGLVVGVALAYAAFLVFGAGWLVLGRGR